MMINGEVVSKDDGDCLILGKQHMGKYRFGKYKVCLTDNQKKVLFGKIGKIGKKLGCGTFACAYAKGRDKVVKFTRDSEDVAALAQAQKTGVVPKLYATYKIKDGGHAIGTYEETPVYAVVVERLRTLDPGDKAMFDEDSYKVDAVMRGENEDEVCDDGSCSDLVREAIEASRKLKAAGIEWIDTHGGNVGYDKKSGKLKVLDLGVTGTQLKEDPKILEGAMHRLRNIRQA